MSLFIYFSSVILFTCLDEWMDVWCICACDGDVPTFPNYLKQDHKFASGIENRQCSLNFCRCAISLVFPTLFPICLLFFFLFSFRDFFSFRYQIEEKLPNSPPSKDRMSGHEKTCYLVLVLCQALGSSYTPNYER